MSLHFTAQVTSLPGGPDVRQRDFSLIVYIRRGRTADLTEGIFGELKEENSELLERGEDEIFETKTERFLGC